MIIYKIESKIDGKIYIGQTKREVSRRVFFHSKRDSHIGRALRKYGLSSFDISVIDGAENKYALDEKERFWIKYYDCRNPNGYNFTDGGEGLTNPSEETKQKIRDTKAKNPSYPSMESRIKMSLAGKGRPKSEEWKEKMRRPKSQEGRENIRRAQGRPEIRAKRRSAMMGNKFALGNHLSAEVIAKRSIKISGVNNGMYGKHHTEEAKAKMRETKMVRKNSFSQSIQGPINVNPNCHYD